MTQPSRLGASTRHREGPLGRSPVLASLLRVRPEPEEAGAVSGGMEPVVRFGAFADPHYAEMARNYRADNWTVIRRIYLPAALPQIFTGFRMAFTRSFVTAIGLELVAGNDGIGAIIWLAWETLATERLYVGILVAATLGIVVHRIFFRLEEAFVPWRH